MKQHVSWIVALVVGLVVGYVSHGAMAPAPSRIAPTAPPGQRPARPVEDPHAVYRVPVDDSPSMGPANALVTIVESSDFECPFCKRAAPTVKQIEEAYRGKIRLVFKYNPLPFHQRAMPAAIAAEEVRAEGGDAKFWAMHDALFASASLDDAAIAAAAKAAGASEAKVREAIQSGRYKDRIARDQRLVQSVGAGGTPTFFVNGRKIVGAQPIESFRAVIDEELRKAEALVAQGTPAPQVYAKIMERASTSPVFLPGSGQQGGPPQPGQPPQQLPSLYREIPVRADDPVRGPADAKLTIVLFSDFQCPFCARVEPSLKQIQEAFPGQVRLVWKHQPLPMHQNAVPAALVAEAARDQGKFWPMHDRLFGEQQSLDDAAFHRHAKELNLDMRRFDQAVASRSGQSRIAEDQKLAAQVSANATPTMFFNCRQVVGAQPFERLRAVAEEELKKADAILAGRRPFPGFYDKACKANEAVAPEAAVPAVPTALAPPPAAPVGHIDVRPDDPARGNAKAPVTIVLFSDFQCPFCARVEPTLAEAERAYGSKLRVVWKHQPLPMHQNALSAALAAEAAREQGKFWPMHDRLFASQRELSSEKYDSIAKEIGLDVRRFQEASRSAKARTRIEDDQKLAARVGAQGTPTMFVNGEKVEGAVPFEMLKAVIDRKLVR